MSASYVEKVRGYERARVTARAGAVVGTTEAEAGTAGADGPSVTAFGVVTMDVAEAIRASRGANVCGAEGAMPGRGVGVATGPSSAAAGVANPMAQSATAMETWRTKAFFFIDHVVGNVSQVVASRLGLCLFAVAGPCPFRRRCWGCPLG